MEYFVECPLCKERFKVLIKYIQGEIYNTICPNCNSNFNFRISQTQQDQQPQFQYQTPQNQHIPTHQTPHSISYFQMPTFKKPLNYNIVGVLLIISALLGYLIALLLFAFPLSLTKEITKELSRETVAYIFALVNIIFSSFALIGGVVAFTGKHHGAIIVGGVHGVLASGFFIGAILSIIALILFYKIKKENEAFEF